MKVGKARYVRNLAIFCVNEIIIWLQIKLKGAPTIEEMVNKHSVISDEHMQEWVQMYAQEMPDDHPFENPRRVEVLKSYFYGCNPVRVAEAVKAGKAIVPYCLRYKDGIV